MDNGEVCECSTGPGTELSPAMATNDDYTDCIMEFDTDYYCNIENLDSNINGGCRFTFGEGGTYRGQQEELNAWLGKNPVADLRTDQPAPRPAPGFCD